MTHAAGDGHHRIPDGVSQGAAELNLDGFCVVRCATSSIVAEAAVTGFIRLGAGAVLVFQVDSRRGLLGSDAPLPPLQKGRIFHRHTSNSVSVTWLPGPKKLLPGIIKCGQKQQGKSRQSRSRQ